MQFFSSLDSLGAFLEAVPQRPVESGCQSAISCFDELRGACRRREEEGEEGEGFGELELSFSFLKPVPRRRPAGIYGTGVVTGSTSGCCGPLLFARSLFHRENRHRGERSTC